MPTQPIGPVPADLIVSQYDISYNDFAALTPNLRALFRMAYETDVWKIVEGASYDPSTGEFVLGPPHNNCGPEVNRMLEIAGVGPGNPWCISAVAAMLVDSGVPRSSLPDGAASTHAWVTWAEDNDLLLDEPVRGCVGILIFNSTSGHGFMISEVVGDSVKTLEGNSNSNGSSDGYELVRHERSIDSITHFIDISKLKS